MAWTGREISIKGMQMGWSLIRTWEGHRCSRAAVSWHIPPPHAVQLQ